MRRVGRFDDLAAKAVEVGAVHKRQKRARVLAAIAYGRLLRQLRALGRRMLGGSWEQRVLAVVSGRETRR